MEATVDPQSRGPDWMPITPKTGSLFHADSQPAPLRRGHERPLSLGPAHGEGVVGDPPGDIDAARIRRERPTFSSVGSSVKKSPPGMQRAKFGYQ
jgi:hypothetical protein